MKKIIIALVLSIFIILAGLLSSGYIRQFLKDIGVVEDTILIAGTGSMYPTFPKGSASDDITRASQTVAYPSMKSYPGGINLFGINLFSQSLHEGDIVDFENDKTDTISQKKYGDKAGFVKRIIGLPGDTIEIRDGFVVRNSTLLKEPYTAKPRSTFGGSFLSDCRKLTVPEGFVFVMGDNRKASLDSRHELGLVPVKDIIHVLDFSNQGPYQINWRDPSNDENTAHQVTLNTPNFISLINSKRKEQNIPPLTPDNRLSDSARRRAQVMIDTNDFSVEATRSGYTLEKSLNDSGYHNILNAETVTQGYYDAGELMDNIFQFPQTKKLILNKKYQDIGISAVLGEINGCPVQSIVLHLGGYEPPNYSKEQIDSWQKLTDTLNGIIPSWENLKNADGVNQDDLKNLLDSLYKRRDNAQIIVDKMKKNLWLTDEEKKLIDEDTNLNKQQEILIQKLNH